METDNTFPYSLTITTPFPTPRLAAIARRALSVDAELSPLVRRLFSLTSASIASANGGENGSRHDSTNGENHDSGDKSMLVTHYSATTPRMLRVSVNGFFESLRVVLGMMRELDVDAVGDEWMGDEGATEEERIETRDLKKVQGLEERGVVGGAAGS